MSVIKIEPIDDWAMRQIKRFMKETKLKFKWNEIYEELTVELEENVEVSCGDIISITNRNNEEDNLIFNVGNTGRAIVKINPII